MLEVVLIYRPGGSGTEGVECRIAASQDADAARTVALAVLRDARRTADEWRNLDPRISAMRQADADRLAAILREVVPGVEDA